MAKVNVEDLPDEVLDQLGITRQGKNGIGFPDRLSSLWRVMRDVSQLSVADCLWVLRTTIKLLENTRETRGRQKASSELTVDK